jgi:hypothetical protein
MEKQSQRGNGNNTQVKKRVEEQKLGAAETEE